MSTTTIKELPAAVASLSATLRGQMSHEAGVIAAPKDLFPQHLATIDPALSMDVVKAVDNAKTIFNAAFADATTGISFDAMKADPKLESVTAKVDVNKDKLAVTVLRTETRPDPQKPGETVTRHGVVKPNYKAYAGRGDVGPTAIVRNNAKAIFAGLAD